MVRVGDVVTVRNRPNLRAMYQGLIESGGLPSCDWISVDPSELKAIVTALPTFEDVSVPVDVGQVVAFLSR